jgi:hypothetical protein
VAPGSLLAAFEAGRRWERRRQVAAGQARLARYEALYRRQVLAAEAALSAAPPSARMTNPGPAPTPAAPDPPERD